MPLRPRSTSAAAKTGSPGDSKTKGYSNLARAQLKQRWGTMKKVTSSLPRIREIVADILMDMETRDRLKSGRGNAMLVCDSVYAACRFFEAFSGTELKDRCAIVTSYSPTTAENMQDHGLFQAICRVNRLDGDDKEYGYIIDYKDLFRSLEGAIKDYTGEAFDGYDRADVEGLLKDRLEQGRERLEETREAVKALCEPTEPPRDSDAYRHYFCDGGKGLAANERKRLTLYRAVASFVRAYANLANEMTEAGYTEAERQTIRDEVGHYEKVRQEIKLASGDYVDLKVHEPAMRHLLDNYIRAEDSEVISKFDDMTLVDLLIRDGEGAIGSLPEGIRGSRRAVAETIENNVRRLIVDEMAVNPKYYEKMSAVLDALIQRPISVSDLLRSLDLR
ncbi:MAG: restriction endonuclease subunit R, partial [Gemmatimonadetes bacterium]|nr:restriction endonuclease subunit R [Gemmatimonadota bacterium]